MNWLKKLFQKKLEPQPEPIKEIIHIPYETIMLRARIQEPAFTRVGYMVDSNYIVTQVKNQLATELLEQIVNQNLIEFKQVQEFGQNIVEAQILVSIKK
jgi:hypothetical protein